MGALKVCFSEMAQHTWYESAVEILQLHDCTMYNIEAGDMRIILAFTCFDIFR